MTPPPSKSDFMAAEEIKGILHGRESSEQERIMRWVSESLSLAITPGGAGGSGVAPKPTPPPAPNPALAGDLKPTSQSRDIKSFVTEKNPKRDVQFAAVAAYFYRFVAPDAQRKETITPKELDDAGRHARGCGFKAPGVTLSNAVNLGYFDRAARGEFRLNAVGENLVAMTLPGGGQNGTKQPRASRKRSRMRRKTRAKSIKKA
jgi:hypothetical protein